MLFATSFKSLKRGLSASAGLLVFLLVALPDAAGQVSPPVVVPGVDGLQWDDTNPAGTVEKFRIYTSRTSPVDLGSGFTGEVAGDVTVWTISNPRPSESEGTVTYYAVATAVKGTEESAPSNEVEYAIDPLQAAQTVDVSLSVNGIGSCDLVAVSSSVDFGDVQVGSSAQKTVDVMNQGNAECIVTGASISSGSAVFSIVSPPTYPLSIAPSGSFSFTVQASPSAVGNASGIMSVQK